MKVESSEPADWEVRYYMLAAHDLIEKMALVGCEIVEEGRYMVIGPDGNQELLDAYGRRSWRPQRDILFSSVVRFLEEDREEPLSEDHRMVIQVMMNAYLRAIVPLGERN